MAIVMFYRRETAYADLFFLAALFLTYHPQNILTVKRTNACSRHNPDSCNCIQTETVSHNSMRYLPMLSLCAMVSMVLSPLMASLWTETGSGNANFSFFQGLFLSLILAVAIAEFAHQITTEMDGDSWCRLTLPDPWSIQYIHVWLHSSRNHHLVWALRFLRNALTSNAL